MWKGLYKNIQPPMSKSGRLIQTLCVDKSKLCAGNDINEWKDELNKINNLYYDIAYTRYSFREFRLWYNKLSSKNHWNDVLYINIENLLPEKKLSLKPGAIFSYNTEFEKIYNYLVNNFLISDFSDKEFLLIRDLASKCNLSEIQECAEEVKDLDNKNVFYLSAIFDRRSAVRLKELEEQEDINEYTKEVFSRLYELHISPVLGDASEEIKTWLDDADVERDLLEERDKIDKDYDT